MRGLLHIASRLLQQVAQITACVRRESRQQRPGEGRVLTRTAIGGELASEGRVRDEQRTILGTDAGEAAKAAAAADAPLRALRERIVAAGIEENDLLRRARHGREQLIEIERALRRLLLAVDLHVLRREHVLARHFQAMTGVIDKRHRSLVRYGMNSSIASSSSARGRS